MLAAVLTQVPTDELVITDDITLRDIAQVMYAAKLPTAAFAIQIFRQ